MFLNFVHAVLPLLAAASVGAQMIPPQFYASLPESPTGSPLTIDDNDPGIKNFTFTNPEASKFWVDGRSIPNVTWNVGDSWSGLMPISSDPDDDRKLFFWFFPPGPGGTQDDIVFWTNGGPGCSSLEGLLQENGPFQWAWGTAHPVRNEFSWTNLSSVLYLEQPIGTGFSTGTATAENEHDIADQIFGFLQQFLEVFKELKDKKLYLSGESYAGMYVPYLADYIYEHSSDLALDLKGFFINDPVIGWDVVQTQIPAMDFVHKYDPVFALNRTFMAQLDSIAQECNYTGYMDKHVKYPPQGLLQLPGTSTTYEDGCNIWQMILNASLIVNPGFNYYRIFDNWPILWDVLGYPTGNSFLPQSPVYFDRADVKAAIHAPVETHWNACVSDPKEVFPNKDKSLPPAFTVLPGAIDKSERVVIAHGLADYALIADGARIVLQNMTWGGSQGFQNEIPVDSFVVDGVGAFGNYISERKLTYYEIPLSGHMIAQFSPRATFQIMQYLMGIRDSP